MPDLVTRLKLYNNEFNSGIEESKEKVKEFQDTADDTSKSLGDIGKNGKKTAQELLSEMAKTEQAARSGSNYRRQLAQIQRTIADLTIGYRNMNAEMRNSPLGQEVASKIQELTAQAAVYRDAIQDVQQEITAMASDTASWDAMKMGIDTISSSIQAFAASGILGADSTEKLVKVIAKLKGIEAATNAVIKIGNALQKNSALMAGISTLQFKALTRAKALETTATKGATVAQRIFNAVAKANPYVLLASAILGVGAALLAFTKYTNKAKEAEEEHQKQLDAEKEAFEEWSSTVGGAAGNALAKFDKLSKEYGRLSTALEKTNWIKANSAAFKELGISITDLSTADSVFINNTEAFKSAIMERARAAAMYNLIVKNFENYAKKLEEINKKEAPFQAGQIVNQQQAKIIGHENDYWTLGQSDRHMGQSYVTLNEAGAELLNEEWRKKQRDSVEKELNALNSDLEKDIADANAKFNAILEMYGVKTSGGNNTTTINVDYEIGSLAEAQAKAQELQTTLNNMSPDNPKFEETKRNLEAAKGEVERIKKLLETAKPSEELNLVPNSLQEAQHFVQVFSKQLQEMDPNSEEFEEILELLNIWKKRQQEINDLINGTTSEAKNVITQYREIVSQAGDINLQLKIGAIDQATAQKMIDDLNKKLSDLGLTAKVKLEVDEESFKSAGDKMRDFVDTMDKVGSIGSAVSSINSVVDSISNLGKTIDEAQNGWESFFAIFQVGMNIFNATATIIETVATVTDLLTAAKTASTAATSSETAAVAADATAQAADAAATTTNAAAHGAAGAAKAGESVASIPYVGPVLAIAAIAAVMAAIIGVISSAKGFATGGIVDAPSKYGDKNIIRVNGGEMILNNRQQKNLFKMLDEGRQSNNNTIAGDVKFKVQGTDLVGVLNNYNKKTNKL